MYLSPAVIWFVACVICSSLTIWTGWHAKAEWDKARTEKNKAEDFQKEKEEASPQIDIKIFTYPTDVPSPIRLPLKEYSFAVQNLNQKSASISDLRIELNFPYIVNEVNAVPLLDSGGDVSVQAIRVYQSGPQPISYAEQSSKSRLTSNYSLEILKANINGKTTNTNLVILTCERWPQGMGLSGEIVVDLSKTPAVQRKPEAIGKYEGQYFYKIGSKEMTGKVNGVIPAPQK